MLNAIRNPHVDIIAHPTGRLIPNREGADLDMEAVLGAAAEHGVALEINAHPSRLDLEDIYARRAADGHPVVHEHRCTQRQRPGHVAFWGGYGSPRLGSG